MKKIVFVLGLVLAGTYSLWAQLTDDEDVIFNAYLNNAFDLIVVDGGNQTATFQSVNDYNLGITENIGTPGIDPGFTNVAMVATCNWNLKIHADDFIPVNGTGSIPINNLGVWCEATGTHQFGTEVSSLFQSDDAALGMTNSDVVLIDLLTDNSGDQTENAFRLHWLMGTMQGSMNTVSMFTQLSNGIFSQGQFTTTVVLTMTEIP